ETAYRRPLVIRRAAPTYATAYAPVYKRVIRPRLLRDSRPRYRTVDALRGGHYPTVVHTAPAYDYAYGSDVPLYSSEVSAYVPVSVPVRRRVVVRAAADYGRAAIKARRTRGYETIGAYASGRGARVEYVSAGRSRIIGGLPRYSSDTITYYGDRHGAEILVPGGARRAYRVRGRAPITQTDVSVQEVYSLPGSRPSSRRRVRCIDASGCY
ncbi:MAG: hypothetical protein C0605_03645, partial [Hyphomicrobiales bacterium]